MPPDGKNAGNQIGMDTAALAAPALTPPGLIDLSLASLQAGEPFRTVLLDPPWRFRNRTGKVAPEHRRLARTRL